MRALAARPPVTSAPVFVAPIVTGTAGVITVTGNPVGTVPATIVVQQPLARTGSASPVLVAAGLLAMLLGLHLIRISGRRPVSG